MMTELSLSGRRLKQLFILEVFLWGFIVFAPAALAYSYGLADAHGSAFLAALDHITANISAVEAPTATALSAAFTAGLAFPANRLSAASPAFKKIVTATPAVLPNEPPADSGDPLATPFNDGLSVNMDNPSPALHDMATMLDYDCYDALPPVDNGILALASRLYGGAFTYAALQETLFSTRYSIAVWLHDHPNFCRFVIPYFFFILFSTWAEHPRNANDVRRLAAVLEFICFEVFPPLSHLYFWGQHLYHDLRRTTVAFPSFFAALLREVVLLLVHLVFYPPWSPEQRGRWVYTQLMRSRWKAWKRWAFETGGGRAWLTLFWEENINFFTFILCALTFYKW
jgi:hypothetical protein